MSKIYLELLDEARRGLFAALPPFLEQLTYFGDVGIFPVEYIGTPYSPDEIQSYLTHAVREYLKTVF